MMSRATHASHQSTGADLMQGQDPCFTLKLPDTTNWIFQYLFISSLVVMIDIFTINAVKCYCRPLVLNLDPDITEAAEQQIIFIKPGESQDQCRCSAHKKLTACLCTWWHFPWSFPGLHESPFLSSFWMSGCQGSNWLHCHWCFLTWSWGNEAFCHCSSCMEKKLPSLLTCVQCIFLMSVGVSQYLSWSCTHSISSSS